jgi:hypothetical protein
VWLSLASVKESTNLGLQPRLVNRPRMKLTHVVLEVLVEALVRVQLGAVGGQEVKLDPLGPRRDPLLDVLGMVGRVVVADQEDLALGVGPGQPVGECPRNRVGERRDKPVRRKE